MPPGGRYVAVRALRKTLYGRVVLARDTQIDQLVVVKHSRTHALHREVSGLQTSFSHFSCTCV
jgi:hypothetical protein